MTINDLIKKHPVPWRHVVQGHGQVFMVDAAGQVVELFTMLEFTTAVTTAMANRRPVAPAQEQPASEAASLG